MAKDLKKSKLAKFDQFLSYCLYLSLKCTVCDFYTDTYILFSSLSLSHSLLLAMDSLCFCWTQPHKIKHCHLAMQKWQRHVVWLYEAPHRMFVHYTQANGSISDIRSKSTSQRTLTIRGSITVVGTAGLQFYKFNCVATYK